MNNVGSLINPASMQDALDSARNAGQRGQSQFFTPLEFARQCAAALTPHRPEVCDLNCGSGVLLQAVAASTTDRLGLDIAAATPAAGTWVGVQRIIGDITQVAPLLHDVGWRCHLFALNPPWGLMWERERLGHLKDSELPAVANAFAAVSGATIDSTLATALLALHHMTEVGEGFLIANHATMERLVFGPGATASAVANHVWGRVTIDGNPMTGIKGNAWTDTMAVDVIWFARSHTVGPQVQLHAKDTQGWDDAIKEIATKRWAYRKGAELRNWHSSSGLDDWMAVNEEWRQSRKANRTDWNVWLKADGTIGTHVSVYDSTATSKRLVRDATDLHKLHDKTPMQLVVLRALRSTLVRACAADSPWRVEPALRQAVDAAVRGYHAARAPLYPLPTVQRLGYLDEEDSIVCSKDLHHPRLADTITARLTGGPRIPADLATPIFAAGRSYPMSTWTTTVTRKGTRPNLNGEMERLEFTGQELVICIQSGEWKIAFLDSRILDDGTDIKGLTGKHQVDICAPLQLLVDHFDIPQVPDVSTVDPVRFQQHLDTLTTLEAELHL